MTRRSALIMKMGSTHQLDNIVRSVGLISRTICVRLYTFLALDGLLNQINTPFTVTDWSQVDIEFVIASLFRQDGHIGC